MINAAIHSWLFKTIGALLCVGLPMIVYNLIMSGFREDEAEAYDGMEPELIFVTLIVINIMIILSLY